MPLGTRRQRAELTTWFMFVRRLTKDNPLFLKHFRELTLPFGCERSSALPTMLRIDLSDVTVPLPPLVRRLHGALAEAIATTPDGACSIHSVWGDLLGGELFKRNARSFLREAFGPTAERFKSRLSSEELMGDMEVALWEMIAPIAKQSDPFDNPSYEGSIVGHSCGIAKI